MNPDSTSAMSEEQAHRVAMLVAGYLRQTLTEAEHDELDAWITANDENQMLFEELTDRDFVEKGLHAFEKINSNAALEKIKRKLSFSKPEKRRNRKRTRIYRAAAILLPAAVFFVYTLMKPKPNSQHEIVETNSIHPGGNYAVLTLEDGKSINLQDTKNGLIDSSGKSEVLKTTDGQLSYENSMAGTAGVYHTLSTPTGGQYSLLLQDGSRVWLNASSSLRYPVSFNGTERTVELTGEGYFEIAHATTNTAGEKKKPFFVKVDGMSIKVLGTHFNINAYKDEPEITTTLLEGSVSVRGRQNNGSEIKELKPGEQAKLGKDDRLQVLAGVDVDGAVAWKNGMFKFKEVLIENIMRQVSRWYDVEIVYEGKLNYHFTATIHRHEPVSKLLDLLEKTNNVHFTIEGKKIIVRP